MKGFYSKFHIGLLALALGVAGVFFWRGMSISWSEVSVELPNAETGEVLSVFPAVHRSKRPRRYVCDEETDPNAHLICIDRLIFSDRDLSLFKPGGILGCGLERQQVDSRGCEDSYRKARDFVWRHWTHKQRAYVAVKASSSETGREWTMHLFIESGDEGKWRVVERTIPMLVPDDTMEPQLGDLIEVKWETATAWEEKWRGLRKGTRILRLTNLVGDSLIL